MAADRPTLGALTPTPPLLIAQAREISAFALPRVGDLARRPGRAADALPDLLDYAAQVPALTRAVRAGVERTTRAHAVATRAHAEDGAFTPWRPATPSDLARLTANLTTAAHRAVPARAHPVRTRAPAPGPVAALSAALERRRDQLRPARPSAAPPHGAYTPARQPLQYGSTP